jgi:hypothetical protein
MDKKRGLYNIGNLSTDAHRTLPEFQGFLMKKSLVGVVCLERDESKAWSVQWMLIPDLVLEERTRVVCNGLQSF